MASGYLLKLVAVVLSLSSVAYCQQLPLLSSDSDGVLGRTGASRPPLANLDTVIGTEPLVADYIVIGAGSAGSVLANRLSEDASSSVLLLEAGGDENTFTDIPIVAQELQRLPFDWAYQTVPQENACFGFERRSSFWPRGKIMGGSSVLNYMIYVRGNPNDYNRWPDGWKWNDTFPYFLKSEDNNDAEIASNGFHSRGGPMDVSSARYTTPLAQAFLDSAPELGYPQLSDVNGPDRWGLGPVQSTLRDGARCSAAKAFLYPISQRPNVQIVGRALATKVVINAH